MNERRRTLPVRVGCFVMAGAMLWATFRDVDAQRLGALLDNTGIVIALVVLPFGIVNLVDAVGWRWILKRLGASVRLLDVFVAQLAGEAAILSLPLGFAVSEPLRPYMLKQRAQVRVDTAVASSAVRKCYLMLGEGITVALSCVLGAAMFERVSIGVVGVPGLEWVAVAVAVFLCGVALSMALILGRGSLATKVLAGLYRVSPGGFVRFFKRSEDKFSATDKALSKFFSARPKTLSPALGFYLLVWLLEALEAFVVLRVLGVSVTFAEALGVEAVLAFLRSLVVVLPAGLGVQDLGYVVFLQALGTPNALVAGAAFSVIKRSKECLWIAIGYGCLFWSTREQRTVALEVAT